MSSGEHDDALVFCGACGTRIGATVRFCTSCGESQARFAEAVEGKEQRRPGRGSDATVPLSAVREWADDDPAASAPTEVLRADIPEVDFQQVSFCACCGWRFDPDARFCEQCGAPRESPDVEIAETDTQDAPRTSQVPGQPQGGNAATRQSRQGPSQPHSQRRRFYHWDEESPRSGQAAASPPGSQRAEAKEQRATGIVIVGYICAVLLPVAGAVIGATQLNRNRHGIWIVVVSIAMVVVSIIATIILLVMINSSIPDYSNL